MTIVTWLLIGLTEGCSIVGQVFFKLAVQSQEAQSRGRFWLLLGAGLVVMGVGFFIWLALLSSLDLSFLYPFEGLNRLAMLIVAAFFLKEKVTARLWLGVVLISAGVALVASS